MRSPGSSSEIYFRQASVVTRLLFSRSVTTLLLFVFLYIQEHLWPTLLVLRKTLVRNLISSKKWFDESDENKFMTKISCYTVLRILSKQWTSQIWPSSSGFRGSWGCHIFLWLCFFRISGICMYDLKWCSIEQCWLLRNACMLFFFLFNSTGLTYFSKALREAFRLIEITLQKRTSSTNRG